MGATLISNGYNLVGQNGSANGFIPTANDLVLGSSISTVLSPLANNGGLTKTHALVSGSVAINAGNKINIPQDIADIDNDGNTSETTPFDQRENCFARMIDSVDIGAFEVSNNSPTNITISNSNIAENQAINTVIGNLTTADPDVGNTFTYSLVTGTNSTDNASFTIVGNQLKTNAAFNFETKNSYGILVRTTDQGGLFYDKPLTIGVNNVNQTPTNIIISNSTVAENQVSGTIIGNFSSTDPDTGSTFTYSLVTGTGSTDNASFTIVGNQLKTNAVFDYETRNNYSVRVRTTDQGGLFYEQQLNIGINNTNEVTNLSQYANSVIGFSSQYTTTSWSANQALGAPNTLSYGDISTAWAASTSNNATSEFLTLGFNTPVYATGVTIRETYGNGFVSKVETLDLANVYQQVWAGIDDSLQGSPADFTDPTSPNPGYGEIDSLTGMVGADIFVLGSNTTAYYDDRIKTLGGRKDYALITDFNAAVDFLQVKSGLNYLIGASPTGISSGTAIFIDNNGFSGLQSTDELIAVLQGVTFNSTTTPGLIASSFLSV